MARSVFAAITKVDAATRKVTGIAMQEVVDRTNEKCLYDESKPFFKAWSANQEIASGGKSKGNVREMHTSSAVGIVCELVCDDQMKAFVIEAEVVDDDAWKKVEKGVYTGFSIGANFAKGHKAVVVDNVLEWVADPVEVSLVDTPCVPTALFEMKYADGRVEKRKFAETSRSKSMYSVSQMASALSDIQYMIQDLQWEAEYENDGSQIPARLRTWLEEGATIFLDLTEEETSEFAAAVTAQKSARADREKKSGGCGCSCDGCSDCSKKKALQTQTKEDEMTPEQTKAFTDAADVMKTATAELTKAAAEIKTIGTTVTAIDTRLKAVEEARTSEAENMKAFTEFVEAFQAEPEPAIVKHVAVPREADKGTESTKSALPADGANLTDKPVDRREAMKAIYAQGGESHTG